MIARRKPALHPVAPDTVRVWRGFMLAGTDYAQFAQTLGSVFVPSCALLQPNAGLTAYVPSMMSQTNKPAAVPDQTALMWWATTTAHDEATKTVAVRAYQDLHGAVYDTKISRSDVPVKLEHGIVANQPVYFFDQPADWMTGKVRHLVGAPISPGYIGPLLLWALAYQKKPPKGVDGALLITGNGGYVAFWEHWTNRVGKSPIDDLAKMVTPFLSAVAENIPPGGGLWDDWAGWDLTKHTCMNVQLDRPGPKGKKKK